MKTFVPASAILAGVAMVLATADRALAGRYSSGPAYRAPTGAPVYGFHPNGQSFTYRPSGTTYSYSNRGGPTGFGVYGPQYRFDAFTRPRNAPTYKTPVDSQPYYFSGRMWYPKPF